MPDVASFSCASPEPSQVSTPTVLDRHAAYRRGLCIDCQHVAPAAGMPRCYLCHSGFTGARLTPEQGRLARIRSMTGPHPSPGVRALAVFVAALLAVFEGR